jgi:tRNA(fMet)-specific endonuclease VapC
LLTVTRTTADRFGRIAAALRQAGTPIPTNDIWIAAQAFESDAELVTFDEHFHAVPGLALVVFFPTEDGGAAGNFSAWVPDSRGRAVCGARPF